MRAPNGDESKSTPALAELQAVDQWVTWKPVPSGDDKPKKRPHSPHTGSAKGWDKPASWGTHAQAVEAATARGMKGTGIVLSADDDLSFIDLDHCYDPATNQLSPKAARLIELAKSYTEISPSGEGVKVWVRGKLPAGLTNVLHGEDGLKLEVYSGDRFGTVTGKHLLGTPDTLNDGTATLKWLASQYGGKHKNQGGGAAEVREKTSGEAFGGRSNELAHVAGGLKKTGLLDDSAIRAALRDHNETRFIEPLPNSELETTVFESLTRWERGKAPAPRRRFTFLNQDELFNQPDPTFLVHDFLVEDTLSTIYAPYASYKSFAALAIAAAVATGRDWAGRTVEQRPVIYVAAEGSRGIKKRLQAWQRENETDTPDLYTLPEAPRLIDPNDVAAFLSDMPKVPGLIVLDTLARCMGGDENSTADMNRFVDALDELRRATQANVLTLHHVNKQDRGLRGAVSFPNAMDTIVKMERKNGPIHGEQATNGAILTCDKQKDYDDFDPLYFSTEVVPLPGDQTSLVLSPCADFSMDIAQTKRLTPKQQTVLDALHDFGTRGASATEWRRAVEATEKTAEATFFRALDELKARGLATATDDGRYLWKGTRG